MEHIKDSENVIAEVLSRNVIITEVRPEEESEASEPFSAMRHLREWAESGPDLAQVENLPAVPTVEATAGTPHQTPEIGRLVSTEKQINPKRNQIHLKDGIGEMIASQVHRYGPIRVTTLVI